MNGSFETGDFTDWVATDLANPFFPLQVGGAGISPGFGFFVSTPTDGVFAALHGFDGDGPGTIIVAQDVFISANTVNFDYRAAWDKTFGALVDREFRVEIEPAGGGAALQSDLILTATAGTTNLDTGPLTGSVDVSAFVGGVFRVSFECTVPRFNTGPAFFQLDNVQMLQVGPSVNFFTDPLQFEQALDSAGIPCKGQWNFKPDNLPAGVIVGISPGFLDIFSHPVLAPTVWDQPDGTTLWPPDIDNVQFVSNLTPQAPLTPGGGIFYAKNGFQGVNNNVLGADFFVDSFDIISGPPAGDKHMAISFEAIQLPGFGFPAPVFHISVYDNADVEIGKFVMDAPINSKLFVGIIMNGSTIGRVDIWDQSGGPEGISSIALYEIPSKCPWDCGNFDGNVGIVDFLALLGQWGGPGSCDFDCGGVGIVDFLALLAHWGPCPCNADFSVIAPGTFMGTTVGAGDDCDVFASDGEDHIYEVFLPNDGTWNFTLCGSAYDTKIEVGTTCCSADIGSNDDFCGLQSQVTAVLAAGTYFVTVDGFGGQTGDYTLTIGKSVVPTNDLCEDAIRIPVPSTVTGDTTLATFDDVGFCGTSNTAPGIWYSVIGTGTSMTASTCGPFFNYDTKISVFCPCDDLTCIGGNDDNCVGGASGLLSTVTWCSQAGAEYRILVHGFSSGVGTFELTVTDDGILCTPDVFCGCGLPDAGDCCVSNGTPGCDNFECCQRVCAADPFCCDNTWDGLCVDGALTFPQCGCNFIDEVFDPIDLSQGPYSIEDFEDGVFLPGVTYTSGSGIAPVLFLASNATGGVTPSGVQGLESGTFRDTIIMDFSTPISSGGLWFGNDDVCCSVGFDARLELFDAGGVVGTIVLPANMNDFADQFMGFNSNKAIVRMIIHYGNDTESLFIYIDDVYFN